MWPVCMCVSLHNAVVWPECCGQHSGAQLRLGEAPDEVRLLQEGKNERTMKETKCCCQLYVHRMADKEQKEVEELQATIAEVSADNWSANSRYRCFFAAQQYYLLNSSGPEEV
ncbi:unnamed protein product [Durusdinium trenchii]|uniref:DNA excision repair protein ERCC-6-like n=1 Tax=Durusdinium trenchii TaxID=1381693 RepID=A0ABP0L3Y8_9DINO